MVTPGGVAIHLPSTYIHLTRGGIHLPGDYIHLPGIGIHLPGDGIHLPGIGIHSWYRKFIFQVFSFMFHVMEFIF